MSRRGVYRGLYSSLFDDPDFQRLSPDAKLVLLTCRLCAQAGAAAIFRAYTGVLAEQTGLDTSAVELALEELARTPSPDRPWIYRESGIVWVRNALRWDPNIRLADPKHRTSVQRAVAALPRLEIVRKFCAYYQIDSPLEESSETLGRPSEDSSSPNTESEADTEYRGRGASTEGRPSSPNGHRAAREVRL